MSSKRFAQAPEREKGGGRECAYLPWLNGKVPQKRLFKYPLEKGKLAQHKLVVRNNNVTQKNEDGLAEGFGGEISQRHNMKINNKKLLNYKRAKQAVREPEGSVEYQGAMGTIKGDKDIPRKLNDLFACICYQSF